VTPGLQYVWGAHSGHYARRWVKCWRRSLVASLPTILYLVPRELWNSEYMPIMLRFVHVGTKYTREVWHNGSQCSTSMSAYYSLKLFTREFKEFRPPRRKAIQNIRVNKCQTTPANPYATLAPIGSQPGASCLFRLEEESQLTRKGIINLACAVFVRRLTASSSTGVPTAKPTKVCAVYCILA
jgi:hypothetical protein